MTPCINSFASRPISVNPSAAPSSAFVTSNPNSSTQSCVSLHRSASERNFAASVLSVLSRERKRERVVVVNVSKNMILAVLIKEDD